MVNDWKYVISNFCDFWWNNSYIILTKNKTFLFFYFLIPYKTNLLCKLNLNVFLFCLPLGCWWKYKICQVLWDKIDLWSLWHQPTPYHIENNCCVVCFFCLCVCLFLLFSDNAIASMWDLSFPTRDGTCVPCSGKHGVLTTKLPRKSCNFYYASVQFSC